MECPKVEQFQPGIYEHVQKIKMPPHVSSFNLDFSSVPVDISV